MGAFGYAWSLPVTWQKFRSHQWHHSNRRIWKPRATRKLRGCTGLFYRSGIIADGSFTLWEFGFSTILAHVTDFYPMIFVYGPVSYSLKVHRMCKYELPTLRLSKVIVWQTDTTEIIFHAASWVVSINNDNKNDDDDDDCQVGERLQVNSTKIKDMDCHQVAPLITRSPDNQVQLIVSRNALRSASLPRQPLPGNAPTSSPWKPRGRVTFVGDVGVCRNTTVWRHLDESDEGQGRN